MPDNYFARYLPLLIHFLLAGALATGMVLLSWLIGQRKPTRAKMSAYECGMTPVGDARQRFSVKFYMVAMLFILFDVEAVFLYPWAIILKDLKKDGTGQFSFWEMIVLHRHRPRRLLVHLEERRAGLGSDVINSRRDL
jgi:NADH-quinone oxidoreductase subunit A